MPTPAPAAPRPPPTPRAILPPASVGSAPPLAWAMMSGRKLMSTGSCSLSIRLVVAGDGAAKVDRGQGGEDEGLQRRHQADLEDEQDHAQRQRHPRDRREAQQDGDA